jgi:tRNA-dihydrouridine synthase B
MIARGSFGQPWIFAQARALIDGKEPPPTPSIEQRFAVALDHAAMVQAYEVDPEGAAVEFRKHLGWYVKGLPNSADLRRRLHAVNSFSEVQGIYGEYVEWLSSRGFDATPNADDAGITELETAEA